MCSETIVHEFSKIALDLNIMYCYPFLKEKTNDSVWNIEVFFPFDPITLPKSCVFFTNLIQEWEDNESHADEEDEEELTFSLQGVSLEDNFTSI